MKIINLFLLFNILLYANDYTLQLYENILTPLFKDNPIVVYTDKQSTQILHKSKKFKVVSYCAQDTELLLGANFEILEKACQNKPLFATSRRAYRSNKNAFGAFYWTKGRPQIHFKPEILQKFHIKLTNDLERFKDE